MPFFCELLYDCVGRGCRQGDPLSPYLFLFGAEIMALLFLMNPEIIGFKINSKEFKLTQFADDTTLILDGSQHSLQAALNTLEIYGNFSGLKMNKEKTKVIWIGKKKYSKDKLNVSVNLDWGKVEFVLLGITFNVNLNLMPDINLVNVLENANTSLKVWQRRKLTPLGKITVLKSLILSKFIHVFLILPIPEKFVSKLNTQFLKFLWNNKPDKTRLGQLGANISPDRSSLTPQVLIENFVKHNYPLLYELQHINLLCLYLPKEDGVSPDAEYITQIIFSIFLQ